MHVVPDVCIRIVRVPLLPPGGAVVPLLLGAILWLPQMLHILPAGLVCLVLRVLAAPFGGLNL